MSSETLYGFKEYIKPPASNSEDCDRAEPLPFTLARDFSLATHDNFLIEDYWQARGIHLLYAAKDRYKSFVACDVAMSVVTGKDWHGHKARQGPVIYIAGEGNSGIQARVMGWCCHYGYDISEMQFALSTMPMQALDETNIINWRHFIARVCEHWGNPALVIIDTLSTNFGPGDENKPTDMARFIAHLKIHIEAPFETSVLIIHHTGKDEDRGARGGSPITANSEEIYTITKPEEEGRVINLVCKNVKDRERPPMKTFEAVTQFLGAKDSKGREMATLVMKEVDSSLGEKEKTSGKSGSAKGAAQKKAVTVLERLMLEQGNRLADKGRNRDEAVVSVHDWGYECVQSGVIRNSFNSAKTSLAANKVVRFCGDNVFLVNDDQ